MLSLSARISLHGTDYETVPAAAPCCPRSLRKGFFHTLMPLWRSTSATSSQPQDRSRQSQNLRHPPLRQEQPAVLSLLQSVEGSEFSQPSRKQNEGKKPTEPPPTHLRIISSIATSRFARLRP
ncbi:hypothetical protein CCHR01_13833 [Colletotrichum chrysophilum]|uniref:Uncharacterized protein n=1 Tax=Colletotrichum chrysophilum TaxID=1836956 RepID=A0AAD9A8R4_9PEZI|nr:hypothetical protein CCHR01_13833 [Colletotrichum chrysophilum]